MATKTPKPIPAAALKRTATVLRVLGHPHRLRIIEMLSGKKLTVGQLAEVLGIAPNACSQHLNNMKAHGILTCDRQGKSIYYQVDDPNALSVIDCIRSHTTESCRR
jgi:ArsR family transcriptional regulator